MGNTPEGEIPAVERSAVVQRRIGRVLREYGQLAAVHDDVGDLVAVLKAIVQELRTGHHGRGEALDHRALAAELEFAPKMLERRGYSLFGREVAVIKELLEDLAADAPPPRREVEQRQPERSRATSESARSGFEASSARQEVETRNLSWIPWMAVGVLGIALVAVLVVLWPTTPGFETESTPATGATVESTPKPTRAPVPAPSAPPAQSPVVVVDRVLPVIAEARHALQEGDLDRARERLSAAAVINHSHRDVHEVAEALIAELRIGAKRAIKLERWQQAEQGLTTALDLAHRFSIDSREIEVELVELDRMDWIARVMPTDSTRMLQLVGADVELELDNGHEIHGRIEALDALILTLRAEEDLGSGGVHFTQRIALAKIVEVRYLIEH